MRDHWWWRPGWRAGRSFYTWHVTFDNQPAAHQLAADYAPTIEGVPTLDPIPPRWLHLTMQGIGFTDTVDRADVAAIAHAAQQRCAALAPFTVTLGPARLDPEALKLPVQPAEPIIALRGTVRAAIADVWGPDRVPEDADSFRPHVSLAYSNAAGPAEPIAERLAAQPPQRACVRRHPETPTRSPLPRAGNTAPNPDSVPERGSRPAADPVSVPERGQRWPARRRWWCWRRHTWSTG